MVMASSRGTAHPSPRDDLVTLVADVPDPELPMLTIGDLGILRSVDVADQAVTVTITPTYLGCPALAEIRQDIRGRLSQAGYADVTVCTALSPPWTSDWISAAGRWKLAAAGVAPPVPAPQRTGPIPLTLTAPSRVVTCPHCGSAATERRAAFGATACRALYRCTACDEPFEYVKEI
jgi:ring-1,2-phenylacetyl-CoA epoxidase subunit PaaD